MKGRRDICGCENTDEAHALAPVGLRCDVVGKWLRISAARRLRRALPHYGVLDSFKIADYHYRCFALLPDPKFTRCQQSNIP